MSYYSRSSHISTPFAPPISQAPPIDRVSRLDRQSPLFAVSLSDRLQSSVSLRRPHLTASLSAPLISGAITDLSSRFRCADLTVPAAALTRPTSRQWQRHEAALSLAGQAVSPQVAANQAYRPLLDECSPLPGIIASSCLVSPTGKQSARAELKKERIIPIERNFVLPAIPGSAEALNDNNASADSRAMSRKKVTNGGSSHSTREADSGGASSRMAGSSRDRSGQGLVGLKNIGNTCYMNAVLQCLSCTAQLHELVLNDRFLVDVGSSQSNRGDLIKAFSSLLQEMWSSSGARNRVIDPKRFKSQLDRIAPRFSGYEQQDAQEFLRYLLEGLHQDINKAGRRTKLSAQRSIDDTLSREEIAAESWRRQLLVDCSALVSVFVGQLQSTLTCGSCNHSSVTFDSFWDLSLPIPLPYNSARYREVDLDECLAAFTREELLDSAEKPMCSRCRRRQSSVKSLRLHRIPPVLVLHLKRFGTVESSASSDRTKITLTVQFPCENLSLSAFSTGSVPQRYDLFAVVNHQGSQSSGHYTAHCRHPFSKQWYLFDDDSVKAVDFPSSVVSPKAYILFYELVSGDSSHL